MTDDLHETLALVCERLKLVEPLFGDHCLMCYKTQERHPRPECPTPRYRKLLPGDAPELLATLEGWLREQGLQQLIHTWQEGCSVTWAREFDADFVGWWHPMDDEHSEIDKSIPAHEKLDCPHGEAKDEHDARTKAAVAAAGKCEVKP